jgi:hypothetical protein
MPSGNLSKRLINGWICRKWDAYTKVGVVVLLDGIESPRIVTRKVKVDVLPKARVSSAQDETVAVKPAIE